MRAMVLFNQTGLPKTIELPEPAIPNENEKLVVVKAVAIKHLDKSRAKGKHYSTENDSNNSKIIGSDGVGILGNGNRIYFFNPEGTLAEKILVDSNLTVPIPNGLDDVTACALPNAIMGSAMGLKFRAKIQEDEVVLINGGTGFTGKVAIQIAKIFGAKKVIVTGRNQDVLNSLSELGADETVLTTDENFINKIKEIHQETPINIVIDYLWGQTAEQILEAIKGDGSFTPKTRFVSIGAMSGDKIQLSSEILRGTDLQISGSGLGSWSKEEVGILLTKILPEMFQLAVENKISVETETVHFDDFETVWDNEITSGKRLVVTF